MLAATPNTPRSRRPSSSIMLDVLDLASIGANTPSSVLVERPSRLVKLELSRFPNELIELLVSRFHRSDLSECAKVSRLFYHLVVPRLWKLLVLKRAAAIHLLLLRNSEELRVGKRSFWDGVNLFQFVRCIDLSRLNTSAGRFDFQVSTQFKILVKHCPELRVLDLSNCLWIRDKDIIAIANSPTLEKLSLHGCTGITGSTLHHVLESSRSLRELSLHGCTSISTLQSAFKYNLAPLASIDMRSIFSLVDINATLQSIFKTCRHSLQHVYIPGHFLSSDAFTPLINIKPPLPLETLHIDSPASLTDTTLSYLSKHTTHLHSLSLNQAIHLTSPSLSALLSHMDALTLLDLSHIPSVDNYLLETLSTHGSLYLRTLKLRACLKVGDDGLKTISRAFPGLHDLYLDYTCVTSEGVKAAMKSGCFGLRVLSLSNCQMVVGTDVHHLARILWWEENCVDDGLGGASGLGRMNTFHAGVGSPLTGLPTVPLSVSAGGRGSLRELSHGSRLQSIMIHEMTGGRASSADVFPNARFSGVLKGKAKVLGGATWDDSADNRPHSVIGAFKGGIGMSRSQSVSSNAGGLVGARGSVAWKELGVPLKTNPSNQNDGIKLDPTLIEFVTIKNIDRIRQLK
ncbi:hypothetical protein BDR26DRAFT_872106 [Obelidium mucronatum]|nr:hypothetical protein BDR26DRAFT_872106 [Obelidium mucronatum]